MPILCQLIGILREVMLCYTNLPILLEKLETLKIQGFATL